eukprot:TRINITY_DN25241_c1_g7_i1.p1 TRINITY_DN25241_c1_g7~~TRINITY_DN25241_c1_g7_i1.p1  ORF type:complete len:251 (-),score=35.39 TRINITY_DN25241_c1_g7_i1:69-821(-)
MSAASAPFVFVASPAAPAAAAVSSGSRNHASRQCKPCAFFHAQGCQSGAACQFCHLCPPREIQRRKRLRRKIAREQLHLAREQQGWTRALDCLSEPLRRELQSEAVNPHNSSLRAPTHASKLQLHQARQEQQHLHWLPAGQVEALGTMMPFTIGTPVAPFNAMVASVLQQNEASAHVLACSAGDVRPGSDSEEPGSPSPFRCVTDLQGKTGETQASSSMPYACLPTWFVGPVAAFYDVGIESGSLQGMHQ